MTPNGPKHEVTIFLALDEIEELDQQDQRTKSHGGWQSLLVGLQQRIDRATGRLDLSDRDLTRIAGYALNYGNGGWENRLRRTFERTLGPELGGGHSEAVGA